MIDVQRLMVIDENIHKVIYAIPNHYGYFIDKEGTGVWTMRKGSLKKLNVFLWGGSPKSYRSVLFTDNSKKVKHKIGKLVLETFVSARPEGNVVRHGIKGKLVDSLDNLKWGTPQQNIEDQYTQNEILRGEDNPMAKLNNFQVRLIRRSFDEIYCPAKYLSMVFNISSAVISQIMTNRKWQSVK